MVISRQAERRAGGAKVFGNEHPKYQIPEHLLAALFEGGKQNRSLPSPLESDEKLATFLNALARNSSIGYEYGLTYQEIIELLEIWRRLARNGIENVPKNLVPERYATSARLDRALYEEMTDKYSNRSR
jgi:hypothetical protein